MWVVFRAYNQAAVTFCTSLLTHMCKDFSIVKSWEWQCGLQGMFIFYAKLFSKVTVIIASHISNMETLF